jgi:hypothetical protein
VKALYCGGCGDLIGLPQDERLPPIRQCSCGRVRARWATNLPHVGQVLFNETLDPITSGDLTAMQALAAERASVTRGADLGELRGEELVDATDALLPESWHVAWDAVMARLEPITATDLLASPDAAGQGSLRAWLVGLHNAILQGAHGPSWGRAPTYLDYRKWGEADGTKFKATESMVIRCRPGDSSDSKLVPFGHLLYGRWEARV